MSRPTVIEHDIQADKVIEREMNDEEFEAYTAMQKADTEAQAEAGAQAVAKTALLEKLGITSEEASLLLS